MKKNPWIGAAYYEDPNAAEHAYKFLGRDQEVSELLQFVDNNICTTLYGKSGIGKTSILNAGLFPRLRKAKYFPVYIRLGNTEKTQSTPDKESVTIQQTIISLLETQISEQGGSIKQMEVVSAENDETASRFFWNYFARHRFYDKNRQIVFPVLVLDQFEEFLRGDSETASYLLRQIAFLAEANHTLPDKTLSDGTRYTYDYNYRFVLSIREDELYRLEDGIDNNYLTPLKQNRMRLRGLSAIGNTGAKEVIRQAGKDCIKPSDIIDVCNNIIQAAPNGDGTVNSLLLSVICYQLYEALGEDQLITREMTTNLDFTLEAFYEGQIAGIPGNERKHIEQDLTDGPLRKHITLDEAEDRIPTALKKAKSLLHIFPMPGSNKMQVELVHDRIAEIANRHKRDKQQTVFRNLFWAVIALMVAAFAFMGLYSGLVTGNKQKVVSSLTEVRDHHFSTADSLWIPAYHLTNNGLVEELAIEDKNDYKVSECPYLSVIDLTKLGKDSLNLELSHCQMLNTIMFPEHLGFLKLTINDCPRLLLSIVEGIGRLEIEADNLKARVDENTTRYVWKQDVLWDVDDRRVVYYKSESDVKDISCSFPEKILDRTIKYKDITFNNTNETNSNSKYSIRTSVILDHSTNFIHRANINSGISSLSLPDSVDYIPDHLCYQFHSLESVKMPAYASYIGTSAFEGCNLLQAITIPEHVSRIEARAFMNCKQLRTMVIPASVKVIGESAFEGCDSLHSVIFLGDSIELGFRAFANNHALTDVKLPAEITIYPSYSKYPFLNCTGLKLPDYVKAPVKPRIKYRSDSVIFYADGGIEAKESLRKLIIPTSVPIGTWTFVNNLEKLTDIYVPYSQPTVVYPADKGKLSFSLELTDLQKGNITLHVPHGCRRYYEVVPEFAAFRQIDELSMSETQQLFIKAQFDRLLENYRNHWLIHTSLFLFLLLLGMGIMKLKHKKFLLNDLPYAALFAILTVVCAIALFWFSLYLIGMSHNLAGVFSIIVSIIMMAWCYLFNEVEELLKNYVQKFKQEFKLPKLSPRVKDLPASCLALVKRHWKKLVAVLVAIVIALATVSFFRKYDDYTYQLAHKNYSRALSLLSDRLLSADNISAQDAAELRRLLILSGATPEFRKTAQHTGWKSYSMHIDKSLCITDEDSLYIWDDSNLYKRALSDNIFGEGTQRVIDCNDNTIKFFNEAKDSSALVILNKDDEQTIKLPGEIQQVWLKQNLVETRKDGKRYICDLQGRVTPMPECEPMSSTTGVNSICIYLAGQTKLFVGHGKNGPVVRLFDSGAFVGIAGNQFLAWTNPSTKDIELLDINNGFTPDSNYKGYTVKSDGCDFLVQEQKGKIELIHLDDNKTIILDGNPQSYSGKFIRYTNESGEYVYDSRTRKTYNLSSQCPSLKRLTDSSRWFQDDRYYFVTDDVYKRTFVFDMNSDGKMIGDINGRFGDNNQLLYHNLTFNNSNYFFVERNDSVQLYRLSDDFIAEGICLPRAYVKAARWKNGFIAIEDNSSATNRSLIYSIIDKCPPTEFYRPLSDMLLNGNTLIIEDSQEIVAYHYDNLCDLIDKSTHLDKQTKQKLITRCKYFQ